MLLASRFCANQTLTPALRATPLHEGEGFATYRLPFSLREKGPGDEGKKKQWDSSPAASLKGL